MVRRCVYGGVLQEGQSQRPDWIISSTPGDAGAKQCTDSGGRVVDDGADDTCASKKSVQQFSGSAGAGLAVSEAVLDPVRRVRDDLAGTGFVQALTRLNYSEMAVNVVGSDPAFAARLAECVGFLSTVCTAVLSGRDDDPLLRLTYDEGLHEWVTELADEVRARMADRALLDALDQVTGQLEACVGRSFGDVAGDLRRQVRMAG